MPPPSSRFIPIRLKLAIAAALLAVVPLAIAGWLVFETNAQALKRSSLALQLGVAEDVARTVSDQIEPVADTLQAIATALADARLSSETKVAAANSLVSGSRALQAVAILDEEGRTIDRIVEQGLRPSSFRVSDNARKTALRSGFAIDVIGGDVPRVIAVARLGKTEATPTADHNRGAPRGFVAGEVPLDGLRARLSRLVDETFVDEIEDIFVVDPKGPVIAQRTTSKERAQDASDLRFLDGIHAASAGKDILNAGPFVDRDGVERFGGLVSRSHQPWAVVVQTSKAKALAPVHQARNIVGATLLAAAILALIIALLLARRLSRPLEQLATMARALAARNFDARTDVTSSDEMGLLSSTMNATAIALKEGEERLVAETQVRHDIARYLPAELVDAVVKREHNLHLGGEKRTVAVLFADIVAFTPLAERLEPEQTVALLNELFTYLTEIIFRHRGTVDKFIGDSVMALFGEVGSQTPDAVDPKAIALSAVDCAEEMLQWLEVGNAVWKEKYGVTLRLAIGVALGEAVVGNIGTDRRMEFTAIGQTVNLAARLEAVARPQQILVSQAVVDACEGAHLFRPLGDQALTTASQPVAVFALER